MDSVAAITGAGAGSGGPEFVGSEGSNCAKVWDGSGVSAPSASPPDRGVVISGGGPWRCRDAKASER